ncbi:hypothetical protein GC173_04040 [bacterium]|nr:hypothetical protein [bacterium]
MTPNRIVWINAALFAIIAALALSIILEERKLPGRPPIDALEDTVTQAMANDARNGQAESSEFAHLGTVNIFETLVPQPTPTQTPAPTPPPPPDIREVTEFWRVVGPMSKFAVFQDTKSKQDFTMKIGEFREERFKGQIYKIYLKSIDKMKSATVELVVDGKRQERVIELTF